MPLSIPCIHLNGTSADELCREIQEASHAIEIASVALSKMTVHGRDHYVKADKESYKFARAEHEARFAALAKIQAELAEIYNGIRDQV
jgi:hypothetical protein